MTFIRCLVVACAVLAASEHSVVLALTDKFNARAPHRVATMKAIEQVIVEHDLSVVDRLAHRVVVLERGQIICDGTPSEVKADTRVQSAYLKGAHRA